MREEREKEEAALREKEKAEAAEAAIQEDAATEVSKGNIHTIWRCTLKDRLSFLVNQAAVN